MDFNEVIKEISKCRSMEDFANLGPMLEKINLPEHQIHIIYNLCSLVTKPLLAIEGLKLELLGTEEYVNEKLAALEKNQIYGDKIEQLEKNSERKFLLGRRLEIKTVVSNLINTEKEIKNL